MTNEERQAAIEWLKGRPITMPGAKKMYALAAEALEAYVPDMNVGDMISRQAAIDALDEIEAEVADGYGYQYAKWREYFVEMPSAQPDIIRCRNCKFASGDSRICMKFGHSPIGELDFCAWAERRTDEE